ncbi:TetR/AcrR family transcriptional regulator [Azospirillum sp. TSO22-1]|uniref:TetR/AcrR family transcriptional regulator n=1 Tax=Azospirillum sp. TSO22-1 TaxID=716789 RepID=UPI000D620C9B|nr:TetR/AcrR family transcriptional regulator [Azospirillum sp. TSO22-1]PWC52657.1 transcriptional regulator [Azospirillum sp. TSO22-1]
MAPRLDSSARRTLILDAALPLFARKGFAATTTKEIAQAAGVSEALIFKHFPSKASLYEAIFLSCIDNDPEYARLVALPPSAATLVQIVQALVSYFLFEVPAVPEERARQRLVLYGLLEDGELMRRVYDGLHERFHPAFTASVHAAEVGGDLAGGPVEAGTGMWMADHLCTMMAAVCLSERSLIAYSCDRRDLARQAIWFILRGLGMREEAIAAQEGSDRFPHAPFDALL